MAFKYFAPLLAAFAVFGINTCIACSVGIQACVAPLGQMSSTMGVTPAHSAACVVVKQASDCVKREMASCPAEMKDLVVNAMKAIETLGQACDDPGLLNGDNIEGCKGEDLEKCANEINSMPVKDKKNTCLAVGKARKCMSQFTKVCKSKFIVDLVKSQESTIDAVEEKCRQEGYATTTENSGRMSSQSTIFSLLAAAILVAYRYIM